MFCDKCFSQPGIVYLVHVSILGSRGILQTYKLKICRQVIKSMLSNENVIISYYCLSNPDVVHFKHPKGLATMLDAKILLVLADLGSKFSLIKNKIFTLNKRYMPGQKYQLSVKQHCSRKIYDTIGDQNKALATVGNIRPKKKKQCMVCVHFNFVEFPIWKRD